MDTQGWGKDCPYLEINGCQVDGVARTIEWVLLMGMPLA